LGRVLKRCLQKDPERRWQSAQDLAAELEWIAEGMPGGMEIGAEQSKPRRRILPIAAAVLLTLASITLTAVWFRLREVQPPSWIGTQLGGRTVALGPRVSPDGQMVAFQTLVDGQTQAAVMKPESGNWSILTHQKQAGFLGD